ncbi:hypothetical protein PR048_013968 [Dryococelus australis]|uniref:Reverse transcriptase domain-containing protein n=1 Tax=Dryococelus australis TaxID=614101 RepID=A0ABQ9HTZ5_9NEOP|nr:hypothetical protein PR048_013968 [Dryococelus australis]
MLVALSGYKILRNDRINKGGGGVAIYVWGNNIKHKILSSSPSVYAGKSEFIIIELTIPPNKVLSAVVYRPLKAAYLSDFEEALSNLIAGYEQCIIMGDFNINLLSNTNEANKLLTTLSCMNITVCPLGATHHTAWIDLMFTSKPKLVLTHGQTSAPGISFHDLIFLSYKLRPPKFKPKIFTYRDFKNIDTDNLNSDAALIPWHEINAIDNLDEKICRFSQMITDLYNRTVQTSNKPPAPWLTNDIVQMMIKRDNAYSRYKRDIRINVLAADSFEQYRMLRNKYTQLVRSAKMHCSLDLFGFMTEPLVIFSKRLCNLWIGICKTNFSSPLNISPEEFNRYFVQSSCCKQLVGDITDTTDINHHRIENESRRKLFYFRLVSLKETYRANMRIKSKAEGPDCVSIRFIHKIMNILLPVITEIFYDSLSASSFPTSWKYTIVKPLAKCTSTTVLDDLRPITLSKALGFLVHQQVYKYVNDNKSFNSYQSGFREGHSTCTSLTDITDSIRMAIDRSHVTTLVLLHFNKSSNMINHDIILEKLKLYFHFSNNVIPWMTSYLRSRHQCVVINGKKLRWQPMHLGVPRSSVLGPPSRP